MVEQYWQFETTQEELVLLLVQALVLVKIKPELQAEQLKAELQREQE